MLFLFFFIHVWADIMNNENDLCTDNNALYLHVCDIRKCRCFDDKSTSKNGILCVDVGG